MPSVRNICSQVGVADQIRSIDEALQIMVADHQGYGYTGQSQDITD